MPFNAIIFDFNGLIVDDEGVHCSLFIKVLADEEITLTEEQYWNDYLGFDDKGLIEAVYKRDGKKITPKKEKDLIAKKNDLYFPELKKSLKFFPGVLDFIKIVHQKYPIAIVSGALKSEIEFVLTEGGVRNLFEIIIAADDTKHGKPDPEGFVMGLAQLKKKHPQIRPETCLVLEDSKAGIEAALRAGMKVVALPHTYPKEELTAASYIKDTFKDVEALLF
ncbi:HAD family phosphatase [bacterium]|nr:HAD family phosphatase [bacterium]